MANKKISELISTTDIKNEDIIPIVQDGITKKIPYEDLKEVAISPTQPTTNESVWIKKGKNLYNSFNFVLTENVNENVTISKNGIIATNTGNYSRVRYKFNLPSEYINKQMTISLKGVGSAVPASGMASRIMINADGSDNGTYGLFTITTTNKRFTSTFTPTTESFYITIYSTTSYSGAVTVTLSEIQLEQGPTATAYEQFIEEKILIKNNAGQFEEYSDVVVSSVKPAQGKVWFKKGNNLYNKNAISAGAYLDTAGEVLSNANYGITDYMEVNSNEYYRYSGITDIDETYAAKACLYDSSKTFLSYINIKKTGDVVLIPSNAKYIRFSIKISDGGENTFVFENNEKEIYVKNDNGIWESYVKDKEGVTILSYLDSTYNIRVNIIVSEKIGLVTLKTTNFGTSITKGEVSHTLATLPAYIKPILNSEKIIETTSGTKILFRVNANGRIELAYAFAAVTAGNTTQIADSIPFIIV